MEKIKICTEFKGGKGYVYVYLVRSDYGIFKLDHSGCHSFIVKHGDYSCLIDGVSPAGETIITISGDSMETIHRKITTPGHFSRTITFSVKNKNILKEPCSLSTIIHRENISR